MAVNETTSSDKAIRRSATSRRLYFGTNVVVMIVLAVMVLVGVNLLAHLKNTRWDLTGGMAGYRVSERTKHVMDLIDAERPVRITTVYASDDPAMARDKYFPRVRDLCEELRQYRRSIEVAHYVSGDDRAQLRDRIQSKFGSSAKEYNDVIAQTMQVWTDLTDRLKPYRQDLVNMVSADAWLGQFSTLANIAAVLQQDLKNIDDTRREVDDLTRGQGIPRYAEANTKIKDLNSDLRQHLEQIENWTKEMDKVVQVLGKPDDPFIATTRQKLPELIAKANELAKITGAPSETQVPEDPKAILRDFAKGCLDLSEALTAERNRVTVFIEAHPGLRQHPRWQIQRGMFVMDLSSLLDAAAEDLNKNGRTLRGYLQRQDVALDQYQNLVRQVRQFAASIQQTLDTWKEGITAILDEGSRIDATSRDFLASAFGKYDLKKAMDDVNDVNTKISELPEMKLDQVATRLQEENIIVVEVGDDVRVITFDEAWPIADAAARQFNTEEEGPARRVFDGDSAVSNGVLAMVSDKPMAKVVLVTFEEEVPPEAQQFRRPLTGPMPAESLRELKQKLEAMHLEVADWNLAADDAKKNRPTADEGVPLVYVFLPTPPAPSPFMRQQGKRFTAEDAKIAQEVLSEEGARGVFLATWVPSMRFGPESEYGWSSVLKDDWGIEVHPERRVIRGVVDRRHPGRYAIDLVQWWYMQINHFTDQPIGSPLRARRMLMKDVCPLAQAEQLPENVHVSPVLNVPAGTTDVWAGTDKDIERIFQALQTGSRDGSFTKGPDAWDPPFSVILAGVNDATKSKVVVMGNGLSLRDDYLQQRVIRLGGRGTQLMTDPPPTENVDLLVNALYWMADRPELIAAGPAEVPVVSTIEQSQRSSVWLITFAWALAALVAGGIVMVVRRK